MKSINFHVRLASPKEIIPSLAPGSGCGILHPGPGADVVTERRETRTADYEWAAQSRRSSVSEAGAEHVCRPLLLARDLEGIEVRGRTLEPCEMRRAEAPIAACATWNDVQVEMGHFLAAPDPIVLIEQDAFGVEGVNQRAGRAARGRDDGRLVLGTKIENRGGMA